MQLISHFIQAATRYPERIAFIQPNGEKITYGLATQMVNRIAITLVNQGLATGAKVAIYSPNDALGFLAMLGTIRAGFTWVSLNARNTVEDNIALTETAEAEVLLFHSQFKDIAEQIKASVQNIQTAICLDQNDALKVAVLNHLNEPEENLPFLADDNTRPCTVFATGGTTGRSKGALWTNLTWETMLANFWTSAPRCNHTVHLCVAPMTHAAGVLAMMLLPVAPTNVIMTKADPVAILEAIEQLKVTHLFLPPTVLYSLLSCPKLKEYDTSSLICFLVAAAPVSSDKLREAIGAFGPVMCQSFGQAEAPMFITFLNPEDHQRAISSESHAHLLKSCGRPTLFSEVEIIDEDGNILHSGETGEIVTRGNLVMAGYYKDPDATEAVSQYGWHHTGDIGYKDNEGYFYIVDRKKDMIISGGFNIFSTDVENALLAHPAILNCAVIGIPDDKWGEAVTAIIELKPETTVTVEELKLHCKTKLGSVKTPKNIEIWDTLPRSPVGKILKRAIREKFWTGLERSV